MYQQIYKYNNLLKLIQQYLVDLQKAIVGLIPINNELENIYNSMLFNQVPIEFYKYSYKSLYRLAVWFIDLLKRVEFIKQWSCSEYSDMHSFWISAMYFPQGFITSLLQQYSRQKTIPIDKLGLQFKSIQQLNHKDIKESVYHIYGVYLDGAIYNFQLDSLQDQPYNKLDNQSIEFLFIVVEDHSVDHSHHFICPLYKTADRIGTLTSTGESSNYILAIDLRIGRQSPQFWILRGVALITQLNIQ